MTKLWTSTAVCLAFALSFSAPARAAGTEPEVPAATDAKPTECKEADKTKCPPAVAAKPADAPAHWSSVDNNCRSTSPDTLVIAWHRPPNQ